MTAGGGGAARERESGTGRTQAGAIPLGTNLCVCVFAVGGFCGLSAPSKWERHTTEVSYPVFGPGSLDRQVLPVFSREYFPVVLQ